MKADLPRVDRILIRGVNWVGDTVLTYPAVERLKSLFPRAHLAILVRSDLVDLWKTSPHIDEIIPFQKRKGLRSFLQDLNLSLSLKRKGFDLAVVLPRSFHSKLPIYLSRIPVRVGYRGKGPSFFLTHGIPREGEVLRVHRVHYYQRLTEILGQGQGPAPVRIALREEDRKWAEERLRSSGLLDGRILVGINPGATYGLAKCWSPGRFAELGRRLVEKWKASVLLFGKKEEAPIAGEIIRHLGTGGVDLTGKTGLLQLAALLERCRLLVTNDTGTMHLATAVGTPVVALFGSTDPVTTGPWGEGHLVVREEVPCSPCLKRICPTDHQCMERITVEEVEEAVVRQLNKRSA